MEGKPEALITGQKLSAELREQSRALRREMTAAERVVWQHVRRDQLQKCHFRRQQVIGGFIVDFYCASARLAVEIDGPIHDRQAERDRNRDTTLSTHGVRILRFTNEQVQMNLGEVLSVIRQCLATPPPSPPLSGEG